MILDLLLWQWRQAFKAEVAERAREACMCGMWLQQAWVL